MKENDNTIIVGAKGEYAEGNHFFRCIKDQYLEKYKINRDLYKLYEKSIIKNPEVLGLKIEREIYRPSIWLLFVEVAEYNNSIRREIVQVGSNKNIFCGAVALDDYHLGDSPLFMPQFMPVLTCIFAYARYKAYFNKPILSSACSTASGFRNFKIMTPFSTQRGVFLFAQT